MEPAEDILADQHMASDLAVGVAVVAAAVVVVVEVDVVMLLVAVIKIQNHLNYKNYTVLVSTYLF